MEINKTEILSKLQTIIVPEVNKPLTQYVSKIDVSEKSIEIEVKLEKKINPLQNSLKKVIENILIDFSQKAVELKINIIPEKVQMQDVKINKPQEENPLNQVKNIIAVASGKGGVGKSTISANLAIALALQGYKVGLLDADVYGPSIPIMYGVEQERPFVDKINEKDYIIPVEKFGVKLISIGFFVKEEDALIWRGAMATSAIKQLIEDVSWGDLDFFVIDLPPGTGDVPLTMVQTIPLTGALIVTTPQKVAVADVVKSISMFKNNSIEVPVLGIIENMAYFTPSDMLDKKYYIFGKGGGNELAKRFNVPLLGQIPIDENVVSNADAGIPAIQNTSVSEAFVQLATKLVEQVELRNKNLPPTKVLKIK